MKILLVVPRYNLTNKKDYNYNFPLGLGYISSVLRKAGYNVDCLNINHYDGKISEILNKKLDSCNYDYVCTGGNALIYAVIESIILAAREHKSNPKFILGGPIITSEPEVIFNALSPDYCVIGEGEETILELLDFLNKKKNLKTVKGIMYRENEKLIMTPVREAIKDIDSIPFPDFDGLEFAEQIEHMHPNEYWRNAFDFPRSYPILCSRSCPYQCTFCYHDSKYRARSMDNIMKEIETNVKKYRINILYIYDECFAINKDRIYDFCKMIRKLQKEIEWELKWICQLRVENIDPEILKVMKESGCDVISYGFESYSPIVLKSMRKSITPEQIDKALKETLKVGIGIQANFILGDVAETNETAKVTLDYWKKNCMGQIGLGFIAPYPGSEIYKHCIRKKIIKDKLNFIKNEMSDKLVLNMTDNMSDKEISKLKNEVLEASSRYIKFVRPLSFKKRDGDIYDICVKCPFCNQKIEYKNCFVPNRWTYGIHVLCRNCHMHFFIVSFVQKIAYEHYTLTRTLRDYQRKIVGKIKKRML